MPIEFKLPEVAEGVESVDIADVLVAVGDGVEPGTVICEVETDKAVAEIESDTTGTVAEILVSAGDSVAIGQPLVTLEPADAGTPAPKSTPAPATSAATEQPAAPASQEPVSAPPAADAEPAIVEVPLPDVAEGVESVDIADVNVAVGDVVEKGTVICEVETDKAVAEIESEYAGTVTAVHISAGTTVAVGSPMIALETVGASGTAAPQPAKEKDSAAAPAPAQPRQAPETEKLTQSARAAVAKPDGRTPAPAGPATRRLARKLGVDLYQLTGTARGGRITIEDVERFVHDRMTQPAGGSGGMSLGVAVAAPLPDFSKFGAVEKQPLNKISRSAASNLSTAWVTIPHVTQHNLADITELEAARKRYVKDNPNSPKITMTAIMIKAVVGALRAFPKVNSSIDMENGELVLKKYYNIGVAVDTPNGLVVPVIRNCDQKNVLQVASELTELAVKARDRKLKTQDMQGASFTITNLGGIGGTYFTPIVNPPEVAILGMSRGQKTLQLEDDSVVERLMLPLSLSYDHRAINGADAARFIVKLSGSLTNFFELF